MFTFETVIHPYTRNSQHTYKNRFENLNEAERRIRKYSQIQPNGNKKDHRSEIQVQSGPLVTKINIERNWIGIGSVCVCV